MDIRRQAQTLVNENSLKFIDFEDLKAGNHYVFCYNFNKFFIGELIDIKTKQINKTRQHFVKFQGLAKIEQFIPTFKGVEANQNAFKNHEWINIRMIIAFHELDYQNYNNRFKK